MLLVLACAATEQPELGGPMDRMPDHTHTSPSGAWTAEVLGGHLTVRGPDQELDLGAEVLPGMAFSPDERTLVFARHRGGPLSDLYLLELGGDTPQPLTTWDSFEDRPAFSPDGTRLAFFSGRTGYASLYVMQMETRAITQITNVGLELRKKRPGHAPEEFVPPPEGTDLRWEGDFVRWTAVGIPIAVRP